MNKEDQKKFLNTFKDASELFEKDDKISIAKQVQEDVASSIASEFFGKDILKDQPIDIDLLLSTYEKFGVDPIDAIYELLTAGLKDKKTFRFHDKDISLEGLPDFFKKAKENFIKQKESEDINNF